IQSGGGSASTYGPDPKLAKSKGRSPHPTDSYPPLKKKKGCGGCCGCLTGIIVLVVLLLVAGVVATGYFGPGRFVKDGYKVVNLEGDDVTVDTAPTEGTFYLATGIVRWQVPSTDVPVALLGREVIMEGDFLEDVSLTAAKVTGTDKARFAKDLEVYAAEFHDLGITLKGKLKGRVIKSLP
ncbi:MAG TPA: hypothetical protein PLA50_20220, partial [Bacteroidia bacterium]|nr:hypothetical protein [Bacteroidia bacterium]